MRQPRPVSPTLQAAGASLRAARERAGLTVADVAARLGEWPGIIERIETGELPSVSVRTLDRVARAVGATLHIEARLTETTEGADQP
jgi:transcriptional regulator with XRE-family HTH domain